MSTSAPALPGTLRWGVWLLFGEAAALATVAAFLLYEAVSATKDDTGQGAFAVIGYAAAIAAALVLLGVQLTRRRRWARAPAIALQLMVVAIAYYMIRGGLPLPGIPIALLGIVIIGLLISAPTREALGIH